MEVLFVCLFSALNLSSSGYSHVNSLSVKSKKSLALLCTSALNACPVYEATDFVRMAALTDVFLPLSNISI